MVLHHIANRASFFVEFASPRDAKRFRHGDLHTLHVVAVPDGLEEGIRKTEEKQILDFFLAEIMIDAKNGRFGKDGVQGGVEFLSRCEIPAKGLFEGHAGVPGASGGAQAFDNGREETGRYGQVMSGKLRLAQDLAKLLESIRVRVVSID